MSNDIKPADVQARDAMIAARAKVLKGQAAARRGLRTGLTPDDIETGSCMLREGAEWPEVLATLPVEPTALEAWRPELERRAKLPPGSDRLNGRDLWQGAPSGQVLSGEDLARAAGKVTP